MGDRKTGSTQAAIAIGGIAAGLIQDGMRAHMT